MQKNHWSCTNNFYKKILTGATFLLAPVANHGWYKPVFYRWHEMTACCYFGVDLGNGLDHYSLSCLATGTPYSSSDWPYFTLLLYLDQIILRPKLSTLSPLDKENILSPIPILQKYSKTISNCVLAKIQSHLFENILKQFQTVS